MDVCGTGGDHLKTFNISTTVAFIVAAAGIPVAKHGNRAITSQAGSADVLEALGIQVDLAPEQAAQSLREHQFAFFFAPKYHPAFKHIGPARKLCAERGQRTIFNVLGPLLNPARPTAQLIGVPQPRLCEPIARVLQSLGTRRGMVVSGCVDRECFLDELSTLGDTTIAEFYQDRGFATSIYKQPEIKGRLSDLAGGVWVSSFDGPEAAAHPASVMSKARNVQDGGLGVMKSEPKSKSRKAAPRTPSHTRMERTRICRRNGAGIDGRGGNLAGTAASFAGEPQIDNSDDRAARPRLTGRRPLPEVASFVDRGRPKGSGR